MTGEPCRLLDDPLLPDVERVLLEVGRSQVAVEYDVPRGLARFRESLRAMALAGTIGATAGTAKATGTVAKGPLLAKVSLKTMLLIGAPAVGAALGLATVNQHRGESSAVARAPDVSTNVRRAVAPPVTAMPAASRGHDGVAEDVDVRQLAAPARPTTSRRRQTVNGRPRATAASEPDDEIPYEQAAAVASDEGTTRAPLEGVTSEGEASSEQRDVASFEGESPSEAGARVSRSEDDSKRAEGARRSKVLGAADGAADEIRHLAEARKLLRENPSAALKLLESMGRAYPRGYFVEERRALTVLALVRLGQKDRARRLATTFSSAYPNGPFTDRIRAAVGL